MKVYLALKHYDYEGFDIIGIYTTKSVAELAILAHKAEGQRADDWTVEEHEVQE